MRVREFYLMHGIELAAAEVNLFITHIMPSAEEFCKTYKEYGITNFISIDTLRTGFLD